MPLLSLGRWWILAGTALAANVVWELAQRPLYAGNPDVAGCLQAAVIDVAYVAGAAALATVAVRRGSGRVFTPVLVGVLLMSAAGVEAWALATERWRYAEAMPTIAGLGLSPLVQLPLLGWMAARVAGLPQRPSAPPPTV